MFNYLKNLFFLFFVFFFTELCLLESDWSISSESQVRLISPLTKNNDLNDLYTLDLNTNLIKIGKHIGNHQEKVVSLKKLIGVILKMLNL